jgi:hypothetical protein
MSNTRAIDIRAQNMRESEDDEFRRMQLMRITNANPKTYEQLIEEYGEVWTNEEFKEQFEHVAFLAPFVSAIHRETGEKRLLMFQHLPRFYFVPEKEIVNPLMSWLGTANLAVSEAPDDLIKRKVQERVGDIHKPRFR